MEDQCLRMHCPTDQARVIGLLARHTAGSIAGLTVDAPRKPDRHTSLAHQHLDIHDPEPRGGYDKGPFNTPISRLAQPSTLCGKFVHCVRAACVLRAHAMNLTRMETHPKPSSLIRTISPLGRGIPKQVVGDIFFFKSWQNIGAHVVANFALYCARHYMPHV